MAASRRTENGALEQQKSESSNVGSLPGKLTLTQNIIGAIKVLALAGLALAALWGLDRLVSSK
jgi:hypothetical protein